jgi:hypothetical protein
MKLTRSLLASLLLSVTAAGMGASGCSVSVPDAPSCGFDDTVACSHGDGYSCTGGDRPEDSSSSLICSYGTAGNAGATLYCCLHAAPPSETSCRPDSTVTGCAPGSFGFSCADSSEPPNAAYSSLRCSAPMPGNAGAALYCCAD